MIGRGDKLSFITSDAKRCQHCRFLPPQDTAGVFKAFDVEHPIEVFVSKVEEAAPGMNDLDWERTQWGFYVVATKDDLGEEPEDDTRMEFVDNGHCQVMRIRREEKAPRENKLTKVMGDVNQLKDPAALGKKAWTFGR